MPGKYTEKKQFLTVLWFQGVISYRIKPKKFFFLIFLVDFQSLLELTMQVQHMLGTSTYIMRNYLNFIFYWLHVLLEIKKYIKKKYQRFLALSSFSGFLSFFFSNVLSEIVDSKFSRNLSSF